MGRKGGRGRNEDLYATLSETNCVAIAMGVMGGTVGAAFGNSLTHPEMIRSYILFDAKTHSFFGIDTWKDFAFFLHDHFPDYPSSQNSGRPNREEVRRLVSILNKE